MSHKKCKKLNRIARTRSSGDASRKSVPKANSSVSNRTESGVKSKPSSKARIRR